MPRYNSLLLSFLLFAPSVLSLEHPLCAKVCVETALKDTRCAGKPSSECFCNGHENGILRDFYTCMSTIVNPCEGDESFRMVAGLYKLCPQFAPATVAFAGTTLTGTAITSFVDNKLAAPWTSVSHGLTAPTTITSGTSTIVVLPSSPTPTANPTGVVVIDGKTVVNGTTLSSLSSTSLTTISSPAPTSAPTGSTASSGTVIITSTAANGTVITSTQVGGAAANGTLTTIAPSSNGTTTEPTGTATSSSSSAGASQTQQVLSPITQAKPNLPVQKANSAGTGLAVGGSSFGLVAMVVFAAMVL